jgi:hypothetical protein
MGLELCFLGEENKIWSSESSGIYCCVVKSMSTDVSEVRAASIIRAMTRRQYIAEDSELHTRRRENLKYHETKNILRAV